MDNKLVITKKDNVIISAFFEGKDMVQVSLNASEESGILGNIYLGKVKNIVKNINAAFVEIADGRMCYYSLGDNRCPIMAREQSYVKEDARLTEVKVKIGDELIVQVVKEDVKTKAPVVSSNLNFTGKYVALTYGKSAVGVSTKIAEEKERKRLKEIAKRHQHKEYGFIIRTNAAYMPEKKITDEILKLIEEYENIRTFGVHQNRFSLLYRTPSNYICDIRDGYAVHVNEFITDDEVLFTHLLYL